MKYLLAIIVLITSLSASELKWNNSYEQALSEAKSLNKDVYMLVTSSNCKWCRKFERTTLQDDSVIKRLKEQYVLLHIDRDKDYMPKKFKKKRVPRHYFITSNGGIIYSFLGYWNSEDFFSFLKDVDERR